ncbi:hypothetical protein [Baaleninema sp.]|uniref:hypothetical protein n=1 Tax=Baaleninema sp. TaxID=3101197 RepID=UPI003D0123BD
MNIQKLEEKLREQETIELMKLSKKNMWLSTFWSILTPWLGYAYTRRWFPLMRLFVISWVASGAAFFITLQDTYDEEEAARVAILTAFGLPWIVSPIENGIAISEARYQIHKITENG